MGVNSDIKLVVAAIALAAICYFYDRRIERLHADGRDRGFTSLLVVIGVAGVLVAYALVDGWLAALRAAVLFAGGGIPMINGSIRRYTAQRALEDRKAEDVARYLLRGRWL